MSLRRFAGYFLALTAVATVAFASSLIGQSASSEAATTDAAVNDGASGDIAAHTAMLFQQMQQRHSHSFVIHTSRIIASR